jgi:hypothetical protein
LKENNPLIHCNPRSIKQAKDFIPMNASRKPVRFLNLLIIGLLIWCGCDSRGLVDVQGSVMLDGKPLPGGLIVFEPADGNGMTAGGKILNGKYKLTGVTAVLPGENIVRITGVFKTGRQIEVGPPAPPGTMTDEVEQIDIPAIYNQTSTLRCKVAAGATNQHDFELHWQ